MREVHDALPGVGLCPRPQARAAGRDARVGRRTGHLDEHQARAAERPRGVVREVPVVDEPVDGRVLGHRRDHDAILQRHAAQHERREHRWRREAGGQVRTQAARDVRVPPPLDRAHQRRVAQPQVLVRDLLRARQERVVELQRFHVPEAPHVLEPHQAHVGRVLDAADLVAPVGLVVRERMRQIVLLHNDRGMQRDRVLERELGPGADREVRRVRGVAQQHDPGLAPIRLRHRVVPGLAGDRREAAPVRTVGEDLVPLQLLGEEAFDEARGRGLVGLGESRGTERRVRGLDDQRALGFLPRRRRVLIGVQVPDARRVTGLAGTERVLAKGVQEARQGHAGTEPHEAVAAQVDPRRERGSRGRRARRC